MFEEVQLWAAWLRESLALSWPVRLIGEPWADAQGRFTVACGSKAVCFKVVFTK